MAFGYRRCSARTSKSYIELESGLTATVLILANESTRPAICLAYSVYPEVEIRMTLRRVDRPGTQSHSHRFEDLHLRRIEESPSIPAFAIDLDHKIAHCESKQGSLDRKVRPEL
jgi:hypothetical protein